MKVGKVIVALIALGTYGLLSGSESGEVGQDKDAERLRAGIAKAMSDGVDLFVERMVLKGKDTDDDDWDVARALFQEIERNAKNESDKNGQSLDFPKLVLPDYSELPILARDALSHEDLFPKRRRALGRAASPRILAKSFIICAGPVENNLAGIGDSVVFANGGIRIARGTRSIIVSGADIELSAGASKCIILARGSIRTDGSVQGSVLRAGGAITASFVEKSRLIAGTELTSFRAAASVLTAVGPIKVTTIVAGTTAKEQPENLPEIARFFDVKSTGIEIGIAADGISIRRLSAECAFVKAGLQGGDSIFAVNSVPVSDPEQFRRLLCRAVAYGQGTFGVRRGSRELQLVVAFGSGSRNAQGEDLLK